MHDVNVPVHVLFANGELLSGRNIQELNIIPPPPSLAVDPLPSTNFNSVILLLQGRI